MNSGQTADCSVLVSYKYNILNFTFYSGMPLYHKKKEGQRIMKSKSEAFYLHCKKKKRKKKKKKSARICKLISLTATFPKAFKLVLQSLGASDECQF